MKLKSFLLTVTTVFAVSSAFAQANILNAKSPQEIGVRTDEQKAIDNDKPLEYGYVDDRDILFAKMTWEKVVLDERSNFPLYYPIDTNNIGSNRRSLYDVLIKNIKNGNIENIYDDSYFTGKRTLKDIESALVEETEAMVDVPEPVQNGLRLPLNISELQFLKPKKILNKRGKYNGT